MNVVYDSEEKINLLVALVVKISKENMEDYVFQNLAFLQRFKFDSRFFETILCVNFKHRLSKDIVHLELNLNNMAVSFTEGESSPLPEGEKDFPVYDGDFLINFTFVKKSDNVLRISNNNGFGFLQTCRSIWLCMAAYAVLSADVRLLMAAVNETRIFPVCHKGNFGYILEISDNEGLFLFADRSVYSQNPFSIVNLASVDAVYPGEPWIEAVSQPSNGRFFYFDGRRFFCRFGKYLTAREALIVLEHTGDIEDFPLYKHPIGGYYRNVPVWLVGSRENKDGGRSVLLVFLNTGKTMYVNNVSEVDVRLALANDSMFIPD